MRRFIESISINLCEKTVLLKREAGRREVSKFGYARIPGTKVFCGLHNCTADSLR